MNICVCVRALQAFDVPSDPVDEKRAQMLQRKREQFLANHQKRLSKGPGGKNSGAMEAKPDSSDGDVSVCQPSLW